MPLQNIVLVFNILFINYYKNKSNVKNMRQNKMVIKIKYKMGDYKNVVQSGEDY